MINNHNSSRRRRYPTDKKQQFMNWFPYVILVTILSILLCIAGYLVIRNKRLTAQETGSSSVQTEDIPPTILTTDESTLAESSTAPTTDELQMILNRAALLSSGYDYDRAIELLTSSSYKDDAQVTAAVAAYEQAKTTLVKTDPFKITHVFFHSLIMDTAKAFDGQPTAKGYNQVMTTKDEFMKILQSMYDKGFVLVRLHDIAYETTSADNTAAFTDGNIMLPPGKQAFVMSQDDVCYYEYMKGDGFATRIIIDANGRPTCEMLQDDGSVATGSFDLVPLLNDFIDAHPDFSYRGAKAVLAFTGYNGILGYRTAPSYNTDEYRAQNPGFDYEKERADAAKVAEGLKANGFELASHSWGHRNMGTISMENFIADTDKWENEVETLTGPCDIILFPFGSDVGDWRSYSPDNERFQYLHSKGFRYFCNVDSNPYWVQLGADYMRQGRRNLDGFRMYYDLPETNPKVDHLSDLFNVSDVFDRSRPTPVVPMS
ncbi:MAG: polysaccharide deacetylase [Clostridium sp.]